MKAERTSSSTSSASRSSSSRTSRSAGQSNRGAANTSSRSEARQASRPTTVSDGVSLSSETRDSQRQSRGAAASESTSVSDLMGAWAAEPAAESGVDLARSIEGDTRKLDGAEPNEALEGALERLGELADGDLAKLDGVPNETLQRVLSFLDRSARPNQPRQAPALQHDSVGLPQ